MPSPHPLRRTVRLSHRNLVAALAALTLVSTQVCAQQLPPPSRTVFKCDVAGKTVYSDSPCLGAQKINIEPTRGLNKSSGRELIGADVRRELQREMFTDAVRPITGMDAKQFETRGRRMKLTPEAQRECQHLDSQISVAEKEETLAKQPLLADIQEQLFRKRNRFRELGC